MKQMTTRTAFVMGGLALSFLAPVQPVRAQPAIRQAIQSISVGPDETITYPSAGPSTYLLDLPDEHVTFFPPTTAAGPYLMFGASNINTSTSGATVLESYDLQTFQFAADLGYSPHVMSSPLEIGTCQSTLNSEFDENYAAPTAVLQDPTLPAGNLIMLYEAENHCRGGSPSSTFYASTGFMRSSDNGKTWPAPVNAVSGGPTRYPVLEPSLPLPATAPSTTLGNLSHSGFIDLDADGNYYLYATYRYDGSDQDNRERIARAKLGQDPPAFLKWYQGSFSQPGIGGSDTGILPALGCNQMMSSISYNDDAGLYVLLFVCTTVPPGETGAWYYSTATSLSLQDWSAPNMIENSQFPVTTTTGCTSGLFDGWYPSMMSPGAATGHTKVTGKIFYSQGCLGGFNSTATPRVFTARSFTITLEPAPPTLTTGSLANAATYVPGGLVPGSWAFVTGTNLATVSNYIWQASDFAGLGSNLPTNLQGTSVTVNTLPAAVYYVDPSVVIFQVPAGVTGTATVKVTDSYGTSNAISAASATNAPGIFPIIVNGVNYAAGVYLSDSKFIGDPSVGPSYRNAIPGDRIAVYATGLVPSPAGTLVNVTDLNGVTVTLGNVSFPADGAALVTVGEFQVNFTVPQQFASMPAGVYPVTLTINGVSSPAKIISNPPAPVVIPIQH